MFYFENINQYWFFKISYMSEDIQTYSEKNLEMDQYEILAILKDLGESLDEDLLDELKEKFETWSGLKQS